MPDQPPVTKEQLIALENENERIRQGVADVTLAWATIENRLVMLLMRILNTRNALVPSAMYFALNGIDARISMVSVAFCALMVLHPDYEKRAISVWGSLMNTLGRLKGVRNKVAHGDLVQVGTHRGPRARLTSPVMDLRTARFYAERNQLPGLSANELRQSAKAIRKATDEVYQFVQFLEFVHAGNAAASLQKLAELEALHRGRDIEGSQT